MNKSSFILVTAVFLITASSLAENTEKPTVPVVNIINHQCVTPPVIDGKLDDPCWKSAYVSPSFYDFKNPNHNLAPNHDTILYITTDGKWLYFGFDCKHPTPNDLKALVRENFKGRVFGDECVKFFINPGLKGNQYFRYVLNCDNVHTIQRFPGDNDSKATGAMIWPSATGRTNCGWTAEVAVPLFCFPKDTDLKKFCLNIFRRKIVADYDAQHVKVGDESFLSCWSPTNSWLYMREFGRIKGLNEIKCRVPFVATTSDVTIGDVKQTNGNIRYDITMTLKSLTSTKGVACVDVVERPLNGKKRVVSKSFPLSGHETSNISVPVPVNDFSERSIEVVIRDNATRMPFQTVFFRNPAQFKGIEAQSRLNYYTNEKNAHILYNIGIPKNVLIGKYIIVRNTAGKELSRQKNPFLKGSIPLPLTDLPDGRHELELILENEQNKPLFKVKFTLEKLPPKPGVEWKIDRGTGGTLLHDGKPFFPFGILVNYGDDLYEEVEKAGFNSIIWWRTYKNIPSYPEVVKLAAKHNLKIIVIPHRMVENRFDEVSSLKELLSKEDYALAKKIGNDGSIFRAKGMLLSSPLTKLTRTERNRIFDEFVDVYLPTVLKRVRSVMNMPNLIGYTNLDEPIFKTTDLDRGLRRMYLKEKEVDPYHPVFVLYSSHIPPDPQATSMADCLGTDPYWVPGGIRAGRNSIKWMATVTAKTVARAKRDGMCPWTVPYSSLYSQNHKRMITGQEQICQTYLALIHGTKGIFYFTQWYTSHKSHWQALKILAGQVKKLTPALVASQPAQQITYNPGTWAPLESKVPDVQARLVRFPDGRYILLIANIRRSPVEVEVHITGVKDKQVRDLFAGAIAPIKEESFKDTLGSRDTRAYVFDQIKSNDPVRIKVNIKPLGKEDDLEFGYSLAGREDKKNIMPNPSFEQTTVPGFPDYYSPRGIITTWKKRIGEPGAPIGLTDQNPFYGTHCLFLGPPVGSDKISLQWRIGPQHDKPQQYVLSFYARTDSDQPVKLLIWSRTFKLDRNAVMINGQVWKRYSVRITVPAKVNQRGSEFYLIINDKSPGRVYLDAIQLEKGQEPTVFEE